MDDVLRILMYLTFFYLTGLLGYQLYMAINNKIKNAKTGWGLAGFSLLLLAASTLLLVGGLYVFIELYAFLMKPEP